MIISTEFYSHYNRQRRSYRFSWFSYITILSFVCFGIKMILKTKRITDKINNDYFEIDQNNQSDKQRNLYSLINNSNPFYSKLYFNENYNGKWIQKPSNQTNSFTIYKGNAKLIFNLKLIQKQKYEFYSKFIIYESNKANSKTILFSKFRNGNASLSSTSDYNTYYTFDGTTSSVINNNKIATKEYDNCYSIFTIHFNPMNEHKIIANLTSVNCSIYFQFEATLENKSSKDLIINVYTVILDIICIISFTSQLYFAFQIDENPSNTNSVCLLVTALNTIWTVYTIYAHFYLLFINTGYFYQFAFPIILYFFHFGCDMKVWILSIEMKYNDTRFISISTFLVLLISFTIYFIIGLRLYLDKKLIIVHMILIWYPQVIYNAIHSNTLFFPIVYMITVTINRVFIPVFFSKRDCYFIDFGFDYIFIFICLAIIISSILLLISQYVFGPRWFILCNVNNKPNDSLYKNKNEIIKLIPNVDNLQCAICLQDLLTKQAVELSKDVEYANDWKTKDCDPSKINQLNEKKRKNILSFLFCFNKRLKRSEYMLTKCNHVFHSVCLELWLEFKNDCPNCRGEIKNVLIEI